MRFQKVYVIAYLHWLLETRLKTSPKAKIQLLYTVFIALFGLCPYLLCKIREIIWFGRMQQVHVCLCACRGYDFVHLQGIAKKRNQKLQINQTWKVLRRLHTYLRKVKLRDVPIKPPKSHFLSLQSKYVFKDWVLLIFSRNYDYVILRVQLQRPRSLHSDQFAKKKRLSINNCHQLIWGTTSHQGRSDFHAKPDCYWAATKCQTQLFKAVPFGASYRDCMNISWFVSYGQAGICFCTTMA